jgi:hypothetical protein
MGEADDLPAAPCTANGLAGRLNRARLAGLLLAISPIKGPHLPATAPPVLRRYPQMMITCVVEYVIDPGKTESFERFGRRWMELVDRHGGTHHGYFLPAEGASDKALALFSFPSLAAYEKYRTLFGKDPDFIDADRIRDESGCVLRYERTFMRPLLPGSS